MLGAEECKLCPEEVHHPKQDVFWRKAMERALAEYG